MLYLLPFPSDSVNVVGGMKTDWCYECGLMGVILAVADVLLWRLLVPATVLLVPKLAIVVSTIPSKVAGLSYI